MLRWALYDTILLVMDPKLPAPILPPRGDAHDSDMSHASPAGPAAPQPGVLPAPQLPAPVVQAEPQISAAPQAHLAPAAEDDVIEKEWVDRAKKIISQTRDNPYEQEKAVSKLQADYIQKRYGKEVKLSGD